MAMEAGTAGWGWICGVRGMGAMSYLRGDLCIAVVISSALYACIHDAIIVVKIAVINVLIG